MQAERRSRTDRLILILGVTVLVLGGLAAWAVAHGARFGFGPQAPAPEERARAQLREHLGRGVEIRYTEAGRGRAICGYGGYRGSRRAFGFISRPNRILTSDDPLPVEYADLVRSFCPGFARRSVPEAPA